MLRLNAYRGLTATMRRGEPGPEGSLGKWHWAEVNQGAGRAGARPRRPARPARRRPVDLPLPALAGELDRGRHDRDPQEHRRRARARAPARMNFGLTEDQETIKRTARELLGARYPPGRGPPARARGAAGLHRRAVGGDRRAGLARAARRGRPGLRRARGAWPRSSATRWRPCRCSPPGRRRCCSTAAGEGERLAGGRRGAVALWGEDGTYAPAELEQSEDGDG